MIISLQLDYDEGKTGAFSWGKKRKKIEVKNIMFCFVFILFPIFYYLK